MSYHTRGRIILYPRNIVWYDFNENPLKVNDTDYMHGDIYLSDRGIAIRGHKEHPLTYIGRKESVPGGLAFWVATCVIMAILGILLNPVVIVGMLAALLLITTSPRRRMKRERKIEEIVKGIQWTKGDVKKINSSHRMIVMDNPFYGIIPDDFENTLQFIDRWMQE